jgi:hypothetical protein
MKKHLKIAVKNLKFFSVGPCGAKIASHARPAVRCLQRVLCLVTQLAVCPLVCQPLVEFLRT